LFLLTISAVTARSNPTDLGKPTNSVPRPPAQLLDGFTKTGPFLKQGGKPVLLFIGTMVSQLGFASGASAVERWALVKALNQFGRLTDADAVATLQCQGVSANDHQCSAIDKYPGYPSFDLGHARFTSPYVVLANRDLIDLQQQVQSGLSPTERWLVQRYVEKYLYPVPRTWADFAWRASLEPSSNRGFPLVSIGGYLRVDAGIAIPGDLLPTTSITPLPVSAVQSSMRHGKGVDGAPYSLVADINAEANVLTAFICYADGLRPKSVCARAAIKTILKRIR
jgi:hypothetical protein